MPVKRRTLRAIPLVRDLADKDIDFLQQAASQVHYPTATTLFSDGQPGDRFYWLKSGTIEIVKPSPDGEVILNTLQAGDHFGEMSLLDEQPRSASARARTDVTVIEIPKATFLTLIQRFPLLLYRAASVNDQRLRNRDRALLDELGAHNRQLQKLYDTSLDISRHLDLDRLLEAIIRRATELLDGVTGALHLYQPSSGQLIAHSPFTSPPPLSNATSRQAMTTCKPAFQNRKRLLAAPVCLDTEVLGVLAVKRSVKAAPFTRDDANLLLLLANQSAIAIENARLYGLAVEKGRMDSELRVAQVVQRNLMPNRAPRIPGYKLAGVWLPARVVAGDYFDYIPLGNGKFGLVIADVSDKGMPAALFMAATRSIVRASLAERPDPGPALIHSNRLIVRDAANGMFVTLFLGILDTRTHQLAFANAGHNFPLLWRGRTQQIEPLNKHNLALGISPDVEYETHQIDLHDGDLLVLYTDGVTDAVNERRQFFGERRLRQLFRENAPADAPILVHRIEKAVSEFVGAQPLFDDITMVALGRTPKESARQRV